MTKLDTRRSHVHPLWRSAIKPLALKFEPPLQRFAGANKSFKCLESGAIIFMMALRLSPDELALVLALAAARRLAKQISQLASA